MLKKIFFAIVLLFSFAFAESEPVKAPVAKFELKTIDGTTISVEGTKNGLNIPDAKGKITFIELWGTHCPPCLMSIPHYINLKNEYKDKIKIYAIESQGTPANYLKEFVKSKGINYTVLTQRENLPFVRYFAARAGWRGAIPYLVILNQKGNVVDIKRGMLPEKYVKSVVEYLLNPPKKELSDSNNTKENNTTKDSNSTKDNNSSK